MLRGGISDPRNKAIMKMLNLIAIGERAGSGVPDIYSIWAEKGWADPVVEERYGPDRTILTLAFVKKQAEKTSGKNKQKKQAEKTSGKMRGNGQASKTIDNKRLILDFIVQNESAGSAEIAAHIGLSQARIRVLLSELSDEGQISPQGKGRSRRYVLCGKIPR